MRPSAVPATSSVAFEHPADRTAELRGRPGEVRFLEVAAVRAVMVDGTGQPGDATFGARMPGLYATAYGLHFALKRRGVDVRVGMLEGLYWMADGSTDFDAILGPNRDTWRWTLFIALPGEATEAELSAALARRAGEDATRAVGRPSARDLRGGHGRPGPLSRRVLRGTRPRSKRLHAAIAAAGLRPHGRHHELYLGDPRRSKPERLRTLIRQPVAPA